MKKKPKTKTRTQRDRFIETARELGCGEDEGRFNETLKRIAPKKNDRPTGGKSGRGAS